MISTSLFNVSRLYEVVRRGLKEGAHEPHEGAMCAMEAAAYIAGEPWSDQPQCVCPIIASFIRSWNDGLPSDEDRMRLLMPLIPEVIGTRSTQAVQRERSTLAADWLVRKQIPVWLRVIGHVEHAVFLERMPEISDFDKCPFKVQAINPPKTVFPDQENDGESFYSLGFIWDVTRSAQLAATGALAARRAAGEFVPSFNVLVTAKNAADLAPSDKIDEIVLELQASAQELVHRMVKIKQ